MVKRKVILDTHLRNLSLYHVCNSWSLKYRGYSVADFEYYSSNYPHWIGFRDIDFTHVLKPKPRKHVCVDFFVDHNNQLTLIF